MDGGALAAGGQGGPDGRATFTLQEVLALRHLTDDEVLARFRQHQQEQAAQGHAHGQQPADEQAPQQQAADEQAANEQAAEEQDADEQLDQSVLQLPPERSFHDPQLQADLQVLLNVEVAQPERQVTPLRTVRNWLPIDPYVEGDSLIEDLLAPQDQTRLARFQLCLSREQTDKTLLKFVLAAASTLARVPTIVLVQDQLPTAIDVASSMMDFRDKVVAVLTQPGKPDSHRNLADRLPCPRMLDGTIRAWRDFSLQELVEKHEFVVMAGTYASVLDKAAPHWLNRTGMRAPVVIMDEADKAFMKFWKWVPGPNAAVTGNQGERNLRNFLSAMGIEVCPGANLIGKQSGSVWP